MTMLLDRGLLRQFDWVLFGLGVILMSFGLVVLYSAGYDPHGTHSAGWLPLETHSPTFIRQLLFMLVGVFIMLLALSVSPQTVASYSYLFYFGCIGLLLLVPLIGQDSNGSRRWISLGFANFQPSELMKLCLILGMARYLSRNPPKEGGYRLTDLFLPFGLFLLPMALIIKQPDLGTALVVGGIGFAMVLFMGIHLKSLIFMVSAVLLAIFPMWHFLLESYQKRRIFALFNPDSDPLGSGYHIIQSKIAVGSGALFGKGFLEGTQTQLEFLPEHTTDFVFSVLAEEWGFIGTMVILALYLSFLFRLLQIAGRTKDLYSVLVTFGIATVIFLHVIVNIGMVIGVLPVVGLPLPLFSYGGTSVLVTMCLLGLALGVSMRRLAYVSKS